MSLKTYLKEKIHRGLSKYRHLHERFFAEASALRKTSRSKFHIGKSNEEGMLQSNVKHPNFIHQPTEPLGQTEAIFGHKQSLEAIKVCTQENDCDQVNNWTKNIPAGSTVLNIVVRAGEVLEKTYLTLEEETISVKLEEINQNRFELEYDLEKHDRETSNYF